MLSPNDDSGSARDSRTLAVGSRQRPAAERSLDVASQIVDDRVTANRLP